MIAKMSYPIASASGKIAGLKAGYYARTNRKTGRVYVAMCPVFKSPPSEAQLAVRRRFRAARRAGLNKW